ncbi:MAG TPA: ABC transporter ATP-binding protein, partial [Thermoanaerobaculia bacterium]|nr:ABC transporter ATP-binding protein [Thermoanaerobaculia bacterium]
MAPGEPLIDLREVTRLYDRGRVAALRGLSLRVERGEWVTLSGPSGSGKSTLLHILSGLDRPTSGRVRFAGREPRTRREWTALRRRRIGFVFQSYNLLAGLTAEENVLLPAVLAGSARSARVRARELFERVELGGLEDRYPSQLSGGQQQRVAIARALVLSPAILLA